jgi:hypothetical protein
VARIKLSHTNLIKPSLSSGPTFWQSIPALNPLSRHLFREGRFAPIRSLNYSLTLLQNKFQAENDALKTLKRQRSMDYISTQSLI